MKHVQLVPLTVAVVALLCTPAALSAKHHKKHPKVPFDHDDDHFKKHGIKKPDPCKDLDINVGIALDSSLSITPGEFTTMKQQAAQFITDTSGFPPANNNLYYTSFWSSQVFSTSSRATNAGDSQASFVLAEPGPPSGSTRLDLALADQEAVWGMPPGNLDPVVVVVTDGVPDNPGLATTAANNLKDLPATIITIGVDVAPGSPAATLLSSIATSPDLFIPLEEFSDLDLTQIVCCKIDTDGDGTVDCEDLCPKDPRKTDPGFCGCGEKDTFPCRCDLHEKGCKKHGKKHGGKHGGKHGKHFGFPKHGKGHDKHFGFPKHR